MAKFGKVFSRLILAAVLFGVCGCFPVYPAYAEKTADDIIREIINDYGCSRDDAAEAIDRLFAELDKTDSDAAVIWRKIYDYWKYANDEMPVNTDTLPDGLPEDDSLCFVVLGYELNPDGTMKPELESRLSTAVKCAERYPNAYILCTGGGTASENTSATEAGIMADRLTENGVAANRIIAETQSLTTAQNAIFSYKILSENYRQINSLVIVSSDYHIPWGAVMFQAECILKNEETDAPKISVTANAACKTDHTPRNYLTSQSAGLLEILNDAEAGGKTQNGSVG